MKRVYNYRTKKLYEFEDNEMENDVIMYKLCVREEALEPGVEVEDDVEVEDERYDSLESAMKEVEKMMSNAAETEDEDFTELDCEDCDDCRVFESPSKRYIFVACPEDEEPNFEITIEDDGEFERELDIPVDDDFEDELEDDLDSDYADEYDYDDDFKGESVASKFAKLRSLFEAEGEEESSDDEETEEPGDEDSEEAEDTDGADSEESSDEDEEMTAVAITVKTDDVDACKDELIDAGVAEEDIEVLDDKDGETEIRIDVNSVMELKDYLSKKGIDLEEEIGGEIVSDDDDSEESGEDGEEGSAENPDAEEEVPELDIDDLGDIFGAEE